MTKTMIYERMETLYAMIAFAEEHGNWRQAEKIEEMLSKLVDELAELKKKERMKLIRGVLFKAPLYFCGGKLCPI